MPRSVSPPTGELSAVGLAYVALDRTVRRGTWNCPLWETHTWRETGQFAGVGFAGGAVQLDQTIDCNSL